MTNEHSGFTSMKTVMAYGANGAEISERAYSLILGGTLIWGFLLNWILVKTAAPSIIAMLYYNPGAYSTTLLIGLGAYLVLVLLGNSLIRTQNTLSSIIGFHLIAVPVGLLASIAIVQYSTSIVLQAVLMTAVVTLSLMLASSIAPDVFVRLGAGLGLALTVVVLYSLVAGFFFRQWFAITDYIVIVIMALYVGYDWVRAHSVFRTVSNAIAAASALYLDIINIFLRVLRILARSRRRD